MRGQEHKNKIMDYIRKNINKGYDEETLKWALISQGYSRVIVEESLSEIQKELAKQNNSEEEKPVIKYELLDKHFKPIPKKVSWWKRILGLQ